MAFSGFPYSFHVGAAFACALSLVMLAHAVEPTGNNLPLKDAVLLDDEIAAALGVAKGEEYLTFTKQELPGIEAELRPSLDAMPRNARGNLDPATVRYALHRLFERTRGWHIVGLDPEGQAWNSSSPAEADVLTQMPAAVRALMERRLQEEGLSAREVAVLAATILHLIHAETVEGLREVYRLLKIPLQEAASEEQALNAVYLYEASYILGYDFGSDRPNALLKQYLRMDEIYPPWLQFKTFSREVTSSLQQGGALRGVSLNFSEVARAVTQIGDRYGHWAKSECKAMKSHLVQMEDHGTGRVTLADFHGSSLNDGKWQFQESAAYLRQLGALDETNPGNKRVIIPNYVDGLSNCVGTKDSHMSCCISECEELLGKVESNIGAPEAAPEDIAVLVATLPSASVPAGRSLPALLVRRLHSIAQAHDGLVPIHGRLFAQWLHHAYPHECPYPHSSGTTRPQNIEDWYAERGLEPIASQQELKFHAEQLHTKRKGGPVENAPWIDAEELFVAAPASEASRPVGLVAIHGASILVAATLLLSLARMVRSARAWQVLKVRKPKPAGTDLVLV